MTNPAELLRTTAELNTAARMGWPAYEATSAALAAPTMRSAGGGVGHSSDVPDPVGSIVASHRAYYETAALVAEMHGIAREIQRRMATVRKQHPETARAVDAAVRAARCSGDVDPTCTNNAVKFKARGPGAQASKYDGLCSRCIRRRQREAQERRAS